MGQRFNPAPGWPEAPEGWLPPQGWNPDPSWPPAPEGWELVVDVDPLAEAQADDAGESEVVSGDGITTPVLEIRASRFAGGRLITPNVVRIWNDRVEEYEHHAVRRKNTKSVNYAQVAQVVINRGLRWTTLSVESAGGHRITILGLNKSRAQEIKQMLDQKVHTVKVGIHVAAVPTAPSNQADSVVDQLTKLADLRDRGVLSEDEFVAQKAKLLS